ncbi:DUF4124 domain-containing protein [Geobacter pickeringii]|uniref:DUF4124 domain-containing protein n=1 Tax=Geobacter pickeringii TaxID=345632 RepID=A0A0B5BDV4_9BACT|nr:DUF4124 domain-containing protein [Geobacter pickeringii]AJE02720.1 hypothetical protein GPICK_04470 [Geobacter pickeringii]
MKRVLLLLLLLASSAYGEIYTWRDSKGVRHYTNSEYEIPERYRKKAKVLDLGIGTKAAPPPSQGGTQPPRGEGVTGTAPQSVPPAGPVASPGSSPPPADGDKGGRAKRTHDRNGAREE